jgi:hypothetical protein
MFLSIPFFLSYLDSIKSVWFSRLKLFETEPDQVVFFIFLIGVLGFVYRLIFSQFFRLVGFF